MRLPLTFFTIFLVFGCTNRLDVEQNYDRHKGELETLVAFVRKIPTAENILAIEIEFQNSRNLKIFHVTKVDKTSNKNWDIKIDSEKTSELLKELSWDKTTLTKIKKYVG